MKLGKFLDKIDPMCDMMYKIYYADSPAAIEADFDYEYFDASFKIPKWLRKYNLISTEDNGSEPVFIFFDKNLSEDPIMRITVVKEKM